MNKSNYAKYFDLNKICREINKYLPDFDKKRFKKAFDFADEAHKGQMRKDGTTPYIVHPVMVVENLIRLHADEDVLISALLHDVPEDTERTLKDVKENFGEDVEFLVDGITKLSKVQYQNNMAGRQIESLKKLFLHSAQDPRVILIKLADRLHNMQTLKFVKPEKRLRIARETLELYVPMANLLGIQDVKSELEDLCFQYLFPLEYKEMSDVIEEFQKTNKEVVKKIKLRLKKAFKEQNIAGRVIERKRNLYSIYKKITADGKTINDVKNRLGVRIVVGEIQECYQVLGMIHAFYTPKVSRFKDYIANPKSNGYQSLHTSVFGPMGTLTEIQIRTEEMHREAEYGIASNFFGTDPNSVLSEDRRSLWVNKVIELEKERETNTDFMEDLKEDILQDRITIFTPMGDDIDLPKGATALDFAYAIHTELGNHSERVEIDGKNAPMTTVLKNGSVVNVISSDDVMPELGWLSFVKTNIARNKIKNYLKKVSKEEKIRQGKKILQKEMDIANLGLLKDVSFKKLNKKLDDRYGRDYQNFDQLFVELGEGTFKASNVSRLMSKSTGKNATKDKEVFKVSAKIISSDRVGLLKDIYDTVYKHSDYIESIKAYGSNKSSAAFTVRFEVDDLTKVGKIFHELEQIDEVSYVYPISSKALIMITWVFALTTFAWIFHPILLQKVNESFEESDLLFILAVDGSLLVLFALVLYLSRLIQNYFPLFRGNNRLWGLIFLMPLFAILVLMVEILYFDLTLSWLTIILEIAFIYVYLVFSFRNFRKYYT